MFGKRIMRAFGFVVLMATGLVNAQTCTPTSPRLDSGATFVPFNGLERLEIRSGRTGTADWEWGVGKNTQTAGQFASGNLDWVSGRTLDWTLTYGSNGSATLTVKNGTSQTLSLSYSSAPNGMRSGNALKFYAKTTADAGAAKVYVVPKFINGKEVTGDLETQGNSTLSEKSLFYYFPAMSSGFTAKGTVKFTFTGTAPPQGSRMGFLVTAGNITCGGTATDTTAPTISSQTPNSLKLNTATPTISAQYADAGVGVDTAKVTLLVDGTNVTTQATISATGVSYTPTTALTNGTHTVQLNIADKANNPAQATWSFIVDTQVPTISGQSPNNSSVNTATPAISAQYADVGTGIDLAKTVLTVDGVIVTAQATATATGINYTPTAALATGAHSATLKVFDQAGNSTQAVWPFSIDIAGPAISAQTPANATTINVTQPAISAQYADQGAGIDTTKTVLTVDGVIVTAQAAATAIGISYTPTAPLNSGVHAVVLKVFDKAGNSSQASWSFSVDNGAPVITGQTPKDVSINNAKPTISAQYADSGVGVDTTKTVLTIDGADVTTQAQATATGINYTPATAFAGGAHTVVLKVVDNAGNPAQTTWTFSIDTQGPAATNLQPNNVIVGANPISIITAQFSDQGAGIDISKVTLTVDGADVTSQAQITANGISYTATTAYASGVHNVTLKVSDLAGNEANSNWSFTTDADGPTISGQSPIDVTLPADALPTITAQFTDRGQTGVNAGSVKLVVDGVDVTAKAVVASGQISYTPMLTLVEGNHTIQLTVADAAGNTSSANWQFKTLSKPVISEQSPIDVALRGTDLQRISAKLFDTGVGIEPSSVRIFVDSNDVTAGSTITADGVMYPVTQAPQDGLHTVKVSVSDRLGNVNESEWKFFTFSAAALAAIQRPTVTAVSPNGVKIPSGTPFTINASFSGLGDTFASTQIKLYVNDVEYTSQATITATGLTFTPTQSYAPGNINVYVELANTTRIVAAEAWTFTIEEVTTYSVEITNPAGPVTVINSKLDVAARALSNKQEITEITLNGEPMNTAGTVVNGRTFWRTVDLLEGINNLSVRATFADGTIRTASQQVIYSGPPRVTIISPADKSVLGRANGPAGVNSPADLTGNVERPVTITGRVSKAVSGVTVNQQQAQLLSGGLEFKLDNFFLREGMNVVNAVATDTDGRVGSATISVSVDQTAPILTVEGPLNGSVTSSSKIDVRGMVNDAVEGAVGALEPRVSISVNGSQALPAIASDRYFLASAIQLDVGENIITVLATDYLGNGRSQDVKVTRVAVGSNRVTMLSGNNQRGAINTELSKPMVVVAVNAAGEPITNLPITFDVVRGTGAISTSQGQPTKSDGVNAARSLVVATDFSGRAQVWATVGKQAGPGANLIRARAQPINTGTPTSATTSINDISEAVDFIATTERGAVARLNADNGVNQFAETGSQPLELLSVVARDVQNNVVPSVTVRFSVAEGDAYFIDAQGVQSKSSTLLTDKNGVTAIRPTIGTTPGVIRIVAVALKQDGGDFNNSADVIGGANFLIQAKVAQEGPANFNGFVYSDKGEPLTGVRVSVGRTALSATTDSMGKFELLNVPAGRIDLFLDGRTSNAQGKIWPSLHFEAYAVRGQNNELAHAIYLPPLLTGSAKTVGGNADVVLTIPGLDGFQMKVKANSVTFPDGSKVGTLIVSPVTADKLPMAPPAGGGRFGVPAWTIQPAGTRFDPPIEVTMPNGTSQPIGDNLPVVQWDHDLSMFVPMGRATVSEDGSILVTDSGSGITKAGWGALCVYDPDKCLKQRPPTCDGCQRLVGLCPTCVEDPAKRLGKCTSADGKRCGTCQDGGCNTFSTSVVTTNDSTCCGGNVVKAQYCCVRDSNIKGSILGWRQVERGKTIEDVKQPGQTYRDFSDRSQFDGPPASDASKEKQLISGPISGVKYSVDGCSVPVDAFNKNSTVPGYANLQKLFPPGLFINATIGQTSTNPLAASFYGGCKQHDFCYQTCRSLQGDCDKAIQDNLLASCEVISPLITGSGFYDDLLQALKEGTNGSISPSPQLNRIRLSLREECALAANAVYLGLAKGGEPAHTLRQEEMCVACKLPGKNF